MPPFIHFFLPDVHPAFPLTLTDSKYDPLISHTTWYAAFICYKYNSGSPFVGSILRIVLKMIKKLLVLLGESVRVVDYQDRHSLILLLVLDGVTGKNSENLS